MQAVVDEEVCTGCGLCVDICPEVFQLEGDVAQVIADPVPNDAADTCQEAVESCPVEAISVKE